MSVLEKFEPVTLESGAIFIGQWQNEQRHGWGKQIWPINQYMKENGLMIRLVEKGKLIHADGDMYEGEWVNDQANGLGRYYHLDGENYEGEWKDGKKHRNEVQKWPDGCKYTGVKGSYNLLMGHFTMESSIRMKYMRKVDMLADKREYEGGWNNNKIHGTGITKCQDGKIHDGEYKNNKKEGQGTFFWPNGKKYVGQWLDGNMAEEPLRKQLKSRQGEWVDGKRIRRLEAEEQQSN
ncbi:unnamed protein product [Paramecium octaurelia]|uniref:Uncharacterized protein n=1 Tax=Paramecium octaurelia TaxID=43137 RepID=A0A8S1UNY6_PAROT|nr:unnamed protein product [Paramecium octaurelia]